MAKSINQVMLMGRLAKDPDLRTTTSGKSVVKFPLAVDKQSDGSDFFEIVAWEKLAELVEKYLHKGSKTIIQGRIENQTWEKDGHKHYKTIITAFDVTFLDSKSDKQDTVLDGEDIEGLDIPF